jgi:hypothetical protein
VLTKIGERRERDSNPRSFDGQRFSRLLALDSNYCVIRLYVRHKCCYDGCMARPKGIAGGTVYYDEANDRFKWSVRFTDDDGRVVRRESAVKVGHADTRKRALDIAEKKAWTAVRQALDEKGKRSDDLTLSEWRDYARKHCFKNLKPRAKDSQDKIMDRYILPLLGDVRIARLTPSPFI